MAPLGIEYAAKAPQSWLAEAQIPDFQRVPAMLERALQQLARSSAFGTGCAVLPPPPDATWRCRPREQATDQSVAARCIQSRKQHRASIQVRGGNSCAEGDEGRFQAFLPPPVLVALYRLLDVGLLCLSLRCPAGSSLQYSPGPTACNRPERSAATSLRHCWTSSARWSN